MNTRIKYEEAKIYVLLLPSDVEGSFDNLPNGHMIGQYHNNLHKCIAQPVTKCPTPNPGFGVRVSSGVHGI